MDAAIPATIALSTTFAIGLLCWVGTAKWGWRWTQIVAGACLGVAGNATFVGRICRTIINIGIKTITGIDAGLGEA